MSDSAAMMAEGGRIWFDARLHPHRSLGPQGFVVLMAALIVVNGAMGLFFLLRGAWPVFGFCGLDVLGVYVAFRLSYRSGRLFETITLTDNRLTVRRTDPKGRAREWSFQPYWLRLHLEPPKTEDTPHGRLLLRSHGRELSVGEFLSPFERVELFAALNDALARQKRG